MPRSMHPAPDMSPKPLMQSLNTASEFYQIRIIQAASLASLNSTSMKKLGCS
jgi:hypothetical protein